MVDENQKMRYSKQELAVIQDTFKDNYALVYALRKFLWQLDMTEEEWKLVKQNKIVADILRKEFVGGLEYEEPLMMTFDPFVFPEITKMTPDDIFPISEAKMIVIDYFKQRLEDLENDKKGTIVLEDMKPKRGQDEQERYINLYARATIISVTERALNDFMILSKKEDETPEERTKRIAKDSSK